MTCTGIFRRAAGAATGSGIPGRKSFYLGLAAAAGAMLGGGLLWQRRQQPLPSLSPPPAQAASPVRPLAGREQVGPLPDNDNNERTCARCRTSGQDKKGLWYRINGQTCCPDCAQEAARKAGVTLTVPPPPKLPDIPRLPQAKRVILKPKKVKIRSLEVESFSVLTNAGQETGLRLVPGFKADEQQQQVKVNKAKWFVWFDQAGRPIAGPFGSIRQAKGLASLMAHFDWTRPAEEFSAQQLQAVVRIANRYRENVEFAEEMRKFKLG